MPGESPRRRGYGRQWDRDRLKVLERDRWTCAYCGVALRRPGSKEGAVASVDHTLPRGHPQRDDPATWLACCRSCNSSKSDRFGQMPPRVARVWRSKASRQW